MILNLENVLKYKSILTTISLAGHPVYSSLYMDFNNQYAYFSNASFAGRVKIEVDDEGEPLLENVFIPVDKLIHLLSRDSRIILDSSGTIHLSKGDTVLSTENDPSYEPPTFDISADPSLSTSNIKDFGVVAGFMKQALAFADAEPDSPLNGVFFRGGSIVGLETSRMFEAENVQGLPEGTFSMAMAKLMISCQNEAELTVASTDSVIQMSIKDELVIQTGYPSDLEIIDIHDKDFQNNFKHDNSVVIKREELLEELNFLSPFLNVANHQRIKIAFEEDVINLIVDEEDKVTTNVAATYSDFSEFEGEERWISGYYLKMIASFLPSEDLTLLFDKESSSMDFDSNENVHIVKVAFADVP